MKSRDITQIALGTALVIVSGLFLKFPTAGGVDVTLQTFFVLLLPLLLGKKAAISTATYVLLGLIGIPVFTKGGGISYVFQPSFGYLVGFIAASLVCGALRDRRLSKGKRLTLFGATSISAIGLLIIYVLGTVYLYFVFALFMKKPISILVAISYGVAPFVLFDLAELLISSLAATRLGKRLNKQNNAEDAQEESAEK